MTPPRRRGCQASAIKTPQVPTLAELTLQGERGSICLGTTHPQTLLTLHGSLRNHRLLAKSVIPRGSSHVSRRMNRLPKHVLGSWDGGTGSALCSGILRFLYSFFFFFSSPSCMSALFLTFLLSYPLPTLQLLRGLPGISRPGETPPPPTPILGPTAHSSWPSAQLQTSICWMTSG